MPDGRSVTFKSNRAVQGVYTRRADGTGSDSLLVSDPGTQEALPSPDGRWLLVRTGGNAGAGGRDVLGLRLGTDTALVPVLQTRFDEEAIALSPDGRWLAYQSDESGTTEIFVRPFPDTDQGKWQISSGGGEAPLWSRDGRELFYLNGAKDMMAVRVNAGASLAPGEPSVLFRVPEELLGVETAYYAPWDVAADGRFIMVRRVGGRAELHAVTIVVENFLEELKVRMRE